MLHFRRVELKYVVPDRLIPSLIDRISLYTQPDPYLLQEGKGRSSYPVTSLYFDSADLQSLHEKEAGILARRKLRLRTYHDSFTERRPCFLEIKRRHDVVISKDRLSLSVGHIHSELSMTGLLDHILKRVEASESVTAEANTLRSWYSLQPTAFVRYQRMPFVGLHDHRFRITVDRRLEGVWNPPALLGATLTRPCLYGHSIVELKFNQFVPFWFHALVQEFELERVSCSKYATILQELRPELF